MERELIKMGFKKSKGFTMIEVVVVLVLLSLALLTFLYALNTGKSVRVHSEIRTIQATLLNNLQNEIKLNLKHNNTLSNSDLLCIKERIRNKISHHINIKLDYFEVIDVENFSFVKEINKYKKYRILIAAYISKIRLIDNILIDW